VYVLKQAWQPVDKEVEENDGVSEARMYAIAGMYENRIYSHERVKTGNDIFSTESFRGDWKIQTYREAVEELKPKCDGGESSGVPEGKAGRKRAHSNEIRSEHEEPYSYIQLLEVGDTIFRVDDKTQADSNKTRAGGKTQVDGNKTRPDGNKIHLHPRALVRILMKKHGYPLRYFVDNLELVTALRDAVQGKSDYAQTLLLTRYIQIIKTCTTRVFCIVTSASATSLFATTIATTQMMLEC